MPELPEVETIARYLRTGSEQPALVGQRLTGGRLLWARTLAEPTPEGFAARLTGQTVTGVGRRAKYLLLQLTQDTLILHLRMSGDLRLAPFAAPLAAHDRLTLDFANGWRLAFNDPRKFGRAWLVADPERVLAGLGPEPLDAAFSAEGLYARLQATRRQLKPLLLDQRFIAGLGNIYTDEALHYARLHPLTRANQVGPEQAAVLWAGIRSVLQEAIQRHGTSIDWVYRGGDYQRYLRAYGRTGQPCPTCGTSIERLVVGQRGTHICPACQVRQPAEGG
jgi:formamidopyrimidine-DNA glycosylase